MKFRTTEIFATLIGAGFVFSAGLASADGWPASIAGTWSVKANTSSGIMSITQFAGAAGSQCKPIRGVVLGDPLEGFYCPGSGRLAFLRKIAASNDTKQTWVGNVSQRLPTSGSLRIGGSFFALPHNNVSGTAGGSLGEYNFSADK